MAARKAKFLHLIIVIILVLSSFSGCSSGDDYKTDIFQLVAENQAVFLADVSKQEYSASLAISGIESVKTLKNCVNFYCCGYGISVSSHEFGFYYSFDDEPLGVWEDIEFCESDDLTADGKGFSGDFQNNSYYTERICDHFWYYEIHF